MAKPVELACERCGKLFTVPAWMVTKGRRFCEDKCRAQDPMKTMLSRVRKEENGCWTYTGLIGTGGYGQIGVRGVKHNTHRLMWILHNKQEPPDGQVVRHTCIGNPACINPDHLIIGTPLQNVHDCIDQGRFVITKGTERSTAKLTEDIVREIRALRKPNDGSRPVSYYKLAKRFGVSYSAVYFAAKGIQWKHVE